MNVQRQMFECVNNNVKTRWAHTNVVAEEVTISKMIKSTANVKIYFIYRMELL